MVRQMLGLYKLLYIYIYIYIYCSKLPGELKPSVPKPTLAIIMNAEPLSQQIWQTVTLLSVSTSTPACLNAQTIADEAVLLSLYVEFFSEAKPYGFSRAKKYRPWF